MRLPWSGPTTIRRSLLRNLVLLILLTSGAILVATYFFGVSRTVEEFSESLIRLTADRTEAELKRLFDPVVHNISVAREWGRAGRFDKLESAPLNALLIPMLEHNPQVSSLMIASSDGTEWLLLRDGDGWLNRITRASTWGKRTFWMRWKDAETPIGEWWKELDYDPRRRPWYQGAIGLANDTDVHWTKPYTFFTTKDPGITASVRWRPEDESGTTRVIGFDVLLIDISKFTTGLRVGQHGMAVVLTQDGAVLGLPRGQRFGQAGAIKRAVFSPAEELGIAPIAAAVRHWKALKRSTEPFRIKSEGGYWRGGFRPFAVGNRTFWIGVAAPEADFLADARRRQIIILLVSVGAIGLAVLMATRMARTYSRPLEALAVGTRRIRDLDLLFEHRIASRLTEVNQLAEAHEQMLSALQSFARYVPIEVVRELLRRGEVARIGGRTERLTVLFTDIRGFTTVAEGMSTETLTAHMDEYFEGMLQILKSHNATIDKLVGDGIVAFWGAPNPNAHHAEQAVKAVLDCRKQLAQFNRDWDQRGLPSLPTCFGMDTGKVLVGNIGARSRLNYTVLGDTVNLASRLEGINRVYGTEALASEAARDAAGDGFVWRHVDVVAVKGRTGAVKIYEPLGETDEVPAEAIAFAEAYERALGRYQTRDFAEGLALARDIDTAHPKDLSVQRLIRLCQEYVQHPPPDDWDAVARFDVK